MSFDVYLQAGSGARRLPTTVVLRRRLQGHIAEDSGTSCRMTDGATLSYGQGRPPGDDEALTSLSINRPGADWLWGATFELLRDYDYFLFWPGGEFALVCDPHVKVPDVCPLPARVVASLQDVLDQIRQS